MNSNNTCFVIMPFGQKYDAEGKCIDFDKIYQYIIKQAVNSLDIRCIRCDEIESSGWIHLDMFEQIFDADIAIVDITLLNANVFYELGIRHSLKPFTTVLVRQEGTHAPFNIQNLRIIDYNPQDLASVDKARRQISSFIKNGLRYKLPDSPVHQALSEKIEIKTLPKILLKTEIHEYFLPNSRDKSICLITGDLQDIRGIDVWVNSENTNMQMARYHDNSISGIIRYLGSKKDDAGCVLEDTIANELEAAMNGRESVKPAQIIVTSSGDLEKTHDVKTVFHAASVAIITGQGYEPIRNINRCITNSLQKMDYLNDSKLQTILFPLMGTGRIQGSLPKSAQLLVEAAIHYFECTPSTLVKKIFFLTYTEEELGVCTDILTHFHGLTKSGQN